MQDIHTVTGREIPKINEIYRHFKGHIYSITAVGVHKETGVPMVIYHSFDNKFWARPLDMFLSPVDTKKYPAETQKNRMENVTNLEHIELDVDRAVNCKQTKIQEIADEMKRPVPQIGEIYECATGGYVIINAIATSTETDETLIVFSQNRETWIMSFRKFLEPADKTKYPNTKQEFYFEKR